MLTLNSEEDEKKIEKDKVREAITLVPKVNENQNESKEIIELLDFKKD